MPIVGLTDHTPAAGAGMKFLGKLFKGSPKNEKGHSGRDLNYFRIEWAEEIKALPEFSEIEASFNSLYGEQPTQFRNVVLLGGTSVHEVFPTFMNSYVASHFVRRCTGDTIVLEFDDATLYYNRVEKPCMRSETHDCGCKPEGRLQMVFLDFCKETNLLGYFQFNVGAIHEIRDFYEFLSGVYATYGSMSGIRFIFGRASKKISAKIAGKEGVKRQRQSRSMAYLQVEPEYVGELLAAIAPELGTGEYEQLPAVVPVPGEPTPEPDGNDIPHGEDVPPVPEESLEGEIVDPTPDPTPAKKRKAKWRTSSNMKPIADETGMLELDAMHATAHLFSSPENQQLVIEGLEASGEYNAKTTKEQLIAMLTKIGASSWILEDGAAAKIVQAAGKYNLKEDDVLKALRVVEGNANIMQIKQFTGSKVDAWAAVIAAACDYEPKRIKAIRGDETVCERALEITESIGVPF